MTKSEVGNRLLQLRRDNRCSQGEFARRLGVSVGAYQGYERGEREAPSSLLWALHQGFGADPLWVLAGQTRELIKSAGDPSGDAAPNDAPDAPAVDPSVEGPLAHGPVPRLRDVLKWVNENRRGPAITPSLIAEGIGEPSATYVERLFAGIADPTFEMLDRISGYVGLEPAWLKHGIGAPFVTRRESASGLELAEALLAEQSNKICVVRSRKSGSILIVVNVDDLRCRTVLTDLTLSSDTGVDDRLKLASFSNTCRKLHHAGGARVSGVQLPERVFSEIAAGRRYPIAVLNQGAPLASNAPWLEDWWDPLMFDRPSAPEYWSGFRTLCADIYARVEGDSVLCAERDNTARSDL